MNWTKTPPTKLGAYWLKLENETAKAVEIYESRGRIMAFGASIHDLAKSFDCEWCGPLVPVEEVEKAYREGWRDCLFSDTIIDGNYATSRARKIVEGEI